MSSSGFPDPSQSPVRLDPVLQRMRDVSISAGIAVSHAARALDYAEMAQGANRDQGGKGSKRRRKALTDVEKRLEVALEELRRIRRELDSTLR